MPIPLTPVYYDMKYVDEKGNLTTQANMYNDELFLTLNIVVNMLNNVVTSLISSDGTVTINGLVVPNKTTAQINTLEPDAALGTIWFDTDVAKLKVKTAGGTIETITST